MADEEAPGREFLPVREFRIGLYKVRDGLELLRGMPPAGVEFIGAARIDEFDILDTDILDTDVRDSYDAARADIPREIFHRTFSLVERDLGIDILDHDVLEAGPVDITTAQTRTDEDRVTGMDAFKSVHDYILDLTAIDARYCDSGTICIEDRHVAEHKMSEGTDSHGTELDAVSA